MYIKPTVKRQLNNGKQYVHWIIGFYNVNGRSLPSRRLQTVVSNYNQRAK